MEDLVIGGSICPKYRNTNEPLEVIVSKLPVAGRRIFSVLGSGVFPLEFLRKGAEKVVAVDNDDTQLFWSRLYFVSIENLSYHEFRKIFLEKQGRQVLSDNGQYREILTEAFDNGLAAKAVEIIVDSPYIEKGNLICPTPNSNFIVELWHACFPKYYQWVGSKDEYEKVQDALRKGKLAVLKGGVPECLHQFEDSSFDVAYLSNVLEWLEQDGDPNSRKSKVDATRNQLARILSPTGIAYLKKLNGISDIRRDWKEFFDITYEKESYGHLLTKSAE